MKINDLIHKNHTHPVMKQKLTFGQRSADKLTSGMGSWMFIIIFMIILVIWIIINSYFLVKYHSGKPFDPYPFILLNLALSCLSALQAPIILMSQNREAQKDRIRAEYDYTVNRKAEREIEEIQKSLTSIKKSLKR